MASVLTTRNRTSDDEVIRDLDQRITGIYQPVPDSPATTVEAVALQERQALRRRIYPEWDEWDAAQTPTAEEEDYFERSQPVQPPGRKLQRAVRRFNAEVARKRRRAIKQARLASKKGGKKPVTARKKATRTKEIKRRHYQLRKSLAKRQDREPQS